MATAVTGGTAGVVDANISSSIGRVAMSAAIGGTAAQLGGGKFANGAVTGAYSRMFNDGYNHGKEKPAWPTKYKKITSDYSEKPVPHNGKLRPHRAIDIKNPHGEPVFSVQDGIVSEVDYDAGAGNYIKVDHGNGLETSYSHTATSLQVGASVTRGQVIGYSDSSGVGTGPHLHFVVRENNIKIDPEPFLKGK